MASENCKSYTLFIIMSILTCASVVGLVLLNLYVRPGRSPDIPTTIVDTIIINATVWIAPGQYSEAIAIKDGKIFDVGDNVNITRYQGQSTRVINAGLGFVVPGFIESHAHTITSGLSLNRIQLRDANSTQSFISIIADYAVSHPDEWIISGNWDDKTIGALPTKEWIDNVTKYNPVFVNRLDGHMALANSLALQRAGINASTPDVPGGVIERYENGEPTGILKDNAMQLVEAIIPEPTSQQKDEALQEAMRYLAQNGITTVHHMGTWDDLDVLRRARANNNLKVRFYAAVPIQDWEQLATFVEENGRGDEWLKWGNLKGFFDGSLGSETALMFQPYLDNPNNTGLYVTSPEDIYAWSLQADKASLHVSIHAIGDRANYLLLNIYKNITQTTPRKDRRFRIEHAQHVRFEDIPLFSENEIIASVQPYHIIDDGNWAETLIGPVRANYTYPFKTFLDQKVRLAFGSDWDVAPASPVRGLYAAVTRATTNGKNPNGWIPSQKIDLESSLLAYTTGASYAEFAENIKGKIERNYLADLVILDKNIFSIAPSELWNVQVKMTMVNGTITYPY